MTLPTVHCSRCNANLGACWLYEKAPGFEHARNGVVLCGACLVKPKAEADDYDDYDDDPACPECHGTGGVMTCCDDMCVGRGECIHGDGNDICPRCGGFGNA